MDQEISERQEMSIPDIFATYGEEYFRNLETELLRELQTGKNCIISCGGRRCPPEGKCSGDEKERAGSPSYCKPGDDL